DRGEAPAVRRAVEQAHPERRLQAVDTAPHRRVLDPEQRGRGHHPAGPRDREQIPQVVGTHVGVEAHALTLTRKLQRGSAPMSVPLGILRSMDATLTLIIGLAVGLVLGGAVGVLLGRARRTAAVAEADPALLAAQHEATLAQVRAELGSELAAAQATLA